jgi:hypothetical protein
MLGAMMVGLSLADVFGNILLTMGLFLLGSGLYQVTYSSIIVFTALMRWQMHGNLGTHQWVAVLLITLALAVSGIGAVRQETGTTATWMPLGFVLTFAGTLTYATVYTLTERMTHNPEFSRSGGPQRLCATIGLTGTALLCGIIWTFCLPYIHQLRVWDAGNLGMYAVLVISSLLHNFSYFVLLKSVGSVTLSVMQSFRSVLVFAISHYAFCSTQASQCFTPWKGAAVVAVVVGILLYSQPQSEASAAEGDKMREGTSVVELVFDAKHPLLQ